MPQLGAEEAYQKYRSRIPWLRLVKDEEAEANYLGCSICMSHETTKVKTQLSCGRFTPGKYLYTRTFREHESSSSVHREALDAAGVKEAVGEQKEVEPILTSPAKEVLGDLTPSKTPSTSASSPAKAASSASSPTKPRRVSAVTLFTNLFQAAYTCMKAGWSNAVFSAMLSFGRFLGGAVPETHDSYKVISECKDIIYQHVWDGLKAEICESPAIGISVDVPRIKFVFYWFSSKHHQGAGLNLDFRLFWYFPFGNQADFLRKQKAGVKLCILFH